MLDQSSGAQSALRGVENIVPCHSNLLSSSPVPAGMHTDLCRKVRCQK